MDNLIFRNNFVYDCGELWLETKTGGVAATGTLRVTLANDSSGVAMVSQQKCQYCGVKHAVDARRCDGCGAPT